MRFLRQRRFVAAALIIAVLILAGFLASVPHARELPRTKTAIPSVASSSPAVSLRDAYQKGTHTLSGTVEAPDACAVASAKASLLGDASSSQSIALAISLAPTTGVCLMLPTKVPFRTTLAAPADLPISVSVNGDAASSTHE